MYQDFRSERELLAKLLAKICQHRADCTQIYAPEFAICLQAFLSNLGVTSQIVAIGRTTFGPEHHELSSSPLAHVALRCFGSDWDAGGSDAEMRFMEQWFDFAQEHTTFTRTVETVDSLDEVCTVQGTPVNADAMSAISEALKQAWVDLQEPGESDKQQEVLVDVPL